MGRGRSGGWVCVAEAEIHLEQGEEVGVGKGVRAGLTSLAPQCLAHNRCSDECMKVDLMCDKL